MYIGVFDLFKVGVGPSSSHTVGPMRAAYQFVQDLTDHQQLEDCNRIVIELFGSLSATGRGHGTDRAVLAGLSGSLPETVDPIALQHILEQVRQEQHLSLLQRRNIEFHLDRDLHFVARTLPEHPNAMTLSAWNHKYCLRKDTYFSVGGGFIETAASLGQAVTATADVPYPFHSAQELLALCTQHQCRISDLMLANECVFRTQQDVEAGLMHIWQTMSDCIAAGLKAEGTLPGGLHVQRRARKLHQSLQQTQPQSLITSTLSGMDWINLYALAVNEENAGGGRMVTAPTNGAAGIIPAVLMYYMTFSPEVTPQSVVPFLLTAAAIGSLCKRNASISGAEVGCQGEVGSACAMAAAGLTEVLGGTPQQVENAAEIALEHNLGLTCDPIGGLVQVPCIERNAIASVKAINATQMALRGDGEHFVSLDKVIHTLRETGRDMLDKYKETSTGGLAVNIIEC